MGYTSAYCEWRSEQQESHVRKRHLGAEVVGRREPGERSDWGASVQPIQQKDWTRKLLVGMILWVG